MLSSRLVRFRRRARRREAGDLFLAISNGFGPIGKVLKLWNALAARLAIGLFGFSCLGVGWALGVVAVKRDLFPYPAVSDLVAEARQGLGLITDATGHTSPWWYEDVGPTPSPSVIHDRQAMAPGLTLVLGMEADNELMARVVDAKGDIVHAWDIDWFDLWSDASHLPPPRVPQSRPGAQIHGAVLRPDGDLVFNFDELGMMRVDACGTAVWRLPVQTHHSLDWNPDTRSFWTSSLRIHAEDPQFPNHRGHFVEYLVAEVSPDGELLQEVSTIDLLTETGLSGLLYLSTTNNRGTAVSGDTLHVNDVELFPSTMSPGVFGPGDVMVSFRNINAVAVFEAETWQAKFLSIGTMIRQHDADFVDGNTISVFDNNNLHPMVTDAQSRIIRIDARDGSVQTVFSGSDEEPFFTNIMGKHQLLDNGNMLITESRRGRAFEVTAAGRLVWEYFNEVEDGVVALLSGAQRLGARFDRAFFRTIGAACSSD